MKITHVLIAAILAVGPVAASATSHQAAGHAADGEVRKVDKEGQKLTIRHGPLPELDMPTPMTMVYRVKDPALRDQVKPGDKIRFVAEKISGQFTVTRIEPGK
jgi:Cu(I)/Ag(I) efflux system periplasmic protein CusF